MADCMNHLLFIIFFFLGSITHLHCHELAGNDESLEFQIESGLFDYDPQSNGLLLEGDNNLTTITRAGGSKTTSLDILQLVGAQEILKTPLYFRSSPLMRRSLLDLPLFQLFARFKNEAYLEMFPFYNQTYEEFYFNNYSHIKHYIDLEQQTLIQQLDNLQFTSFNIPEILSLFDEMKVQERRTGLMLQFVKNAPKWSFSIRTPFYYQEHNFYLTPAEQNRIENYPLFTTFEGDLTDFIRQHLISDSIGFGDTRLNFEFLLQQDRRYDWGAGFRFTLPTGFAFKKGLIGSKFPTNKPSPKFNLHEDLLNYEDPLSSDPDKVLEQQEAIADFSTAVLDRLSTILLKNPQGNGHHVGVGIFSHSTLRFSSWVSLGTLTSIEILTPVRTTRFFIVNYNKKLYDTFDWNDSTVQVTDKIKFLNDQLDTKFFPPGLDCMVFPGFIFQNTTALRFEGDIWNGVIGTDLWWHTKEQISDIQIPLEYAGRVEVDKARIRHGFQTKVWGALERNPKEEFYWIRNKDESRQQIIEISPWSFGLRAECTTNSYTIGKDWTISLYIKNDF